MHVTYVESPLMNFNNYRQLSIWYQIISITFSPEENVSNRFDNLWLIVVNLFFMIRPHARNQWFLNFFVFVTNTQSRYIRHLCLEVLKIRFFFEFLETNSDRFVCRLVVIVVPRVFYCYWHAQSCYNSIIN